MLSTVFACLILLTNDDAITADAAADSANSSAPPAIIAAQETADAATPPTTQEWTLRYQFRPEEKLRYQTHQTMTLDARIGQNRKVDVSELKQRRVFTVISADQSGDAKLAMQFEHVWMKMQSDDREPVLFDSTMKPNEVPTVFRNTAHQLKGSAPKYRLSSCGVSLFDADRIAKAVTQAAVEQSEPASGNPIELKESAASSDRTVAQTAAEETDPGSFLAPLPEQPISIGETWKETIPVSVRLTKDINRTVTILRTYRMDSVENGIATISFRSSITSPITGPSVQAQLIQATPRGSLQFDIGRGVMLRRDLQFNETVIGAFGRESILSSVGTNTEELLEPEAK